MSDESQDYWQRAERALLTARALSDADPDGAASRAYYAAFYAVRALFAAEGRSFGKHTQVEAAVHRDLVKTGRWPAAMGAAYSWLADLRATGDYGGAAHVQADEARAAAEKAASVLAAVRHAIRPG